VKFTRGTNVPSTSVDEGDVTITGTGLLKPLGTCAFDEAEDGYLCTVDSGSGGAVVGAAGGAFTYSFPAEDFSGFDGVGSTLEVSGFENEALNGRFPIISQPDVNNFTFAVINQNEGAAATAGPVAGVTFRVLGGFSPIPTVFGANADFLSDGVTEDDPPVAETVHIVKEAGPVYPAIDATIQPQGEGFTLDGTQPHEFPFDEPAVGVTFGCTRGGAEPTCGFEADELFAAMTISGRTTDFTIPEDAPDFFMPPVSAANTYVTFQCSALGAKTTSIGMSAELVQMILDSNPTRIETRVFRFAGEILTSGDSSANVVVGHGFVGHTSPPSAN